MDYWQILLLIIAPSLLLMGVVIYLIQLFFKEERQKRNFEIKKLSQKEMTPHKFNAYERIALFLERIKPSALAQRIQPLGDISAYELALIKNIQMEYDHNLSQQIYINPETWKIIYSTKNTTMNFIKQCSESLEQGANAEDLQEAIIRRSIDEQSPSSKAMLYLQKDIQGN